MNYLSEEHQELTESQSSNLMKLMNGFSFDNRMFVIVGCLTLGTLTSALAWQGTSSERILFCIELPNTKLISDRQTDQMINKQICKDQNNRPFRMTRYHWDKWEKSGRSSLIVQKRVEPATNSVKPFMSGLAFISFGLAGWMFRQLQHDENRKSKLDVIRDEREENIAKLETQRDMMETVATLELTATDNAVLIQQAELLGEFEVKITQIEVSEMLFDVETAGMTDEQKSNYVEFIRKQQTPYLTGTQTLEKTCSPKDKVDGREQNILETDWLTHAIDYFCILIWGGQNGGKTTAASHVIKGKKDRGDRIIVLDPHAAKGQWEGLEVIGCGMDYKAINDFMKWYFEECEHRYKLLRSEGEKAVQKLGQICIVAEELTNYAKRCDNSPEFIQACLSDNRKIFVSAVFVSHGRTLNLMGGSQGTAKTRDDSFMELHCIPPTGGSERTWAVKYPGGDFNPVDVPNWETIFNFSEPSEPPSEPLNQRIGDSSEDNSPRFTGFNLTREQVLGLINSLSPELNQTELIERLWACKKGGSAAWKNAYDQFKQLTGTP
jgi:hypothetical protein